MARVAAELTGFDAPTLPIDLCRAASPARAAYWRAMVAHLRRDVLTSDEVLDGPLTRTALFRGLVATLLETFPNPAVAARIADGHGRSLPVTLRRAVHYIEEHAGDDIGLTDIAAAAGLGLLGALVGALASSLADEPERTPAVVTLLVTASGVTVLGLASAPLGLAAGLLVRAVLRSADRARVRR